MLFKILYFLCVAAEFYAVPTFLKYYWPQKCKMSFIWKTVASSLFDENHNTESDVRG